MLDKYNDYDVWNINYTQLSHCFSYKEEFMMGNQDLFLVDQKDGFNLEFSKLISMMTYTRKTTLEEVKDLSVEQLDYLIHEQANSIGMLLAHMASVEKAYQIDTFEKRDFAEEDLQILSPGLELGNAAREQINGNSLTFYLEQLEQTRRKTLDTFRTLPEAWLFEQTPFWGDKPTNNYFKWFHVMEDELNHRGQIRLIKKMILMQEKQTHHA